MAWGFNPREDVVDRTLDEDSPLEEKAVDDDVDNCFVAAAWATVLQATLSRLLSASDICQRQFGVQ